MTNSKPHHRATSAPRAALARELLAASLLLAALLPAFSLTLRRNGSVVETGVGANVLDSPANALVHLREVLASQPLFPTLAAGEIVTTGTVTDAWPVAQGETWTSDYGTLPVRGLTLTMALSAPPWPAPA